MSGSYVVFSKVELIYCLANTLTDNPHERKQKIHELIIPEKIIEMHRASGIPLGFLITMLDLEGSSGFFYWNF